jgi:hypothetical protein
VSQAREGLREKEVNKNDVERGKQNMAEMMMMRGWRNEDEEENKLKA